MKQRKKILVQDFELSGYELRKAYKTLEGQGEKAFGSFGFGYSSIFEKELMEMGIWKSSKIDQLKYFYKHKNSIPYKNSPPANDYSGKIIDSILSVTKTYYGNQNILLENKNYYQRGRDNNYILTGDEFARRGCPIRLEVSVYTKPIIG